MGKVVLDAKGQKCPLPILQVMAAVSRREVVEGDLLEVVADCRNFPDEIRHWCDMFGKVLVFVRDEGFGIRRVQVRI